MMAGKDPLGYVIYVQSYAAVNNSNALDAEKTNRPINGFPWAAKAYLVRDTKPTVHAFAKQLKSLAVEHAYKQSPAICELNPATLAASESAGTANAPTLAYRQMRSAVFTPIAIPEYANLTGNGRQSTDR